MYITVMHSGKDKKNAYVKLVEAYRQDGVKKTRVIKTLGRLDELTKKDPHFLERIKAQYSKQRQAKKKATVEARLESAKRVLATGTVTALRPLSALANLGRRSCTHAENELPAKGLRNPR